MRRRGPALILPVLLLAGASLAQDQMTLIPGVLARDPFDRCDGLYRPYDQWYMIDNFGSFSLGDTVIVTSTRMDRCVCDNYNTYTCLHDNTISAWRDFDFGCGTLVVDTEYGCASVFSTYGIIGFDGASGFSTGDSVHVVGTMQLEPCVAIPECAADVCLFDRAISACPDSNTATTRVSWGKIRALFRDSSGREAK